MLRERDMFPLSWTIWSFEKGREWNGMEGKGREGKGVIVDKIHI
jgi:hypothetical protein